MLTEFVMQPVQPEGNGGAETAAQSCRAANLSSSRAAVACISLNLAENNASNGVVRAARAPETGGRSCPASFAGSSEPVAFAGMIAGGELV